MPRIAVTIAQSTVLLFRIVEPVEDQMPLVWDASQAQSNYPSFNNNALPRMGSAVMAPISLWAWLVSSSCELRNSWRKASMPAMCFHLNLNPISQLMHDRARFEISWKHGKSWQACCICQAKMCQLLSFPIIFKNGTPNKNEIQPSCVLAFRDWARPKKTKCSRRAY